MAGTVVLSSQRAEGVIRWARILATADAGDAEYPTPTLRSLGIHIDGTIIGVVTNPGATAPTDNWDLTLIDGDGLDRLAGACANRDTANAEYAAVGRAASPDEELTLTIANNAVNSAVIEIVLVWTASSSAGGSSGSSGGGDASLAEQQAQTALLTTMDADTGSIAALLATIDADTGSIATSATTLAGAVYTEGGTDATIAGIVAMWEDSSDTLRAVSAAKPLPATHIPSATPTITTQADQATNATLLSADATRRAWVILNDSDQLLYLKCGATATSTDHTWQVPPGGSIFCDFYNGRVDGIWAADSSGSARITSFAL